MIDQTIFLSCLLQSYEECTNEVLADNIEELTHLEFPVLSHQTEMVFRNKIRHQLTWGLYSVLFDVPSDLNCQYYVGTQDAIGHARCIHQ